MIHIPIFPSEEEHLTYTAAFLERQRLQAEDPIRKEQILSMHRVVTGILKKIRIKKIAQKKN